MGKFVTVFILIAIGYFLGAKFPSIAARVGVI